MSPARRLLSCSVALVAFTSGCGDPASPSGRPGIQIVTGASVSDTIGVTPREPIKVVVRDSEGHPMSDVIVQFTALRIPRYDGELWPGVWMLDEGGLRAFARGVRTASDGSASTQFELGTVAGSAGIAVSVAGASYVDTARYVIRPGAAVSTKFYPGDIAVTAGSTVSLRGAVSDRAGNARTEPVGYRVVQGDATVTPAGLLSAPEPTYAAVIATSPLVTKSDTAWVSVVPTGSIATIVANKLTLMRLDGSGSTVVPHPLEASEPSPEWSPDGQSLFVTLGDFDTPYRLFRVSLSGATTPIASYDGAGGGAVMSSVFESFAPSPDGEWLYLSMSDCNLDAILYRLRPGTTNAERLSPVPPPNGIAGDCFDTMHRWPSPSPDGARFVYENDSAPHTDFSLRIFDVGSRTITPINVVGRRPRWSPTGDLIAYYDGGRIWVVSPDGTGARPVSPAAHTYLEGATWSPDGVWLLAHYRPSPGLADAIVTLLNVRTGAEIPLPYASTYGLDVVPVWRPGS